MCLNVVIIEVSPEQDIDISKICIICNRRRDKLRCVELFSGGDEDSSAGRGRGASGGQRLASVDYELPSSVDSKYQYTTLDREHQSSDRLASCSPASPHSDTRSYLVLDDEEEEGESKYETVRDADAAAAAPNSRHIDISINITSDKTIVYKVIS